MLRFNNFLESDHRFESVIKIFDHMESIRILIHTTRFLTTINQPQSCILSLILLQVPCNVVYL